jgi:CRP-like cAMP-binding protein
MASSADTGPLAGRRGTAEEVRVALAGLAPFAALDPTSLDALARGARLRTWPAGALIFSRGDAGDTLLAVVEGRIRLSLSSARGREIVLATLGPGAMIGEMALLDGAPRSADASALRPTRCIVLPRAGFEAVASRCPDVGLALARHLCALLRSTNYQMESIALYDLQTRLVRFLLSQLARQPAAAPGRRVRLALGLSQGEVAAILGASRPKVSMAFQALVAAGALVADGAELICDVDALEGLAEGDAEV